MAKPPTFPTLYNEALQINISKFKQWGYLNPNQIKSGILNWSTNGNHRASISIIVNTTVNPYFIELDYKYKDTPRKYKVEIISVPSNLGKGNIFYFRCPSTKRRCRILYLIDGYFLHRKAFQGCMYDCQKLSRKYKGIFAILDPYLKSDKYYSELNKKHFKKTYAGRPTKRYLQLMKLIEKAERVTPEMFENYLRMK